MTVNCRKKLFICDHARKCGFDCPHKFMHRPINECYVPGTCHSCKEFEVVRCVEFCEKDK